MKAVIRRSRHVERGEDEGASHGPLKLQPASNRCCGTANVVLTARVPRARYAGAAPRQHGDAPAAREAAVYGWNESIGSNAIEVHIHSLRRKLAPG